MLYNLFTSRLVRVIFVIPWLYFSAWVVYHVILSEYFYYDFFELSAVVWLLWPTLLVAQYLLLRKKHTAQALALPFVVLFLLLLSGEGGGDFIGLDNVAIGWATGTAVILPAIWFVVWRIPHPTVHPLPATVTSGALSQRENATEANSSPIETGRRSGSLSWLRFLLSRLLWIFGIGILIDIVFSPISHLSGSGIYGLIFLIYRLEAMIIAGFLFQIVLKIFWPKEKIWVSLLLSGLIMIVIFLTNNPFTQLIDSLT